MESREFDLLDRHFKRLERCLEPSKLLRCLSQVGVLDEDDVENVKLPNDERPTREMQVQTLLDILKRRENGLKYFIKALLRSKTQDFLARELLEDEHFTEIEVTAFIKETENELDETQTLKLKLLEQLKKRHENTKHGLLEVQSSRSSVILSDSGCDPDEKVDHDDGEVVDYLVRELERERRQRQDAESVQRSQERRLNSLVRKQGSSFSELRKEWPLFRSVDFLNTLCEGKDETRPGAMNRSVSLNVLNNYKLFEQEFETGADQKFELDKWPSGGVEINENEDSQENEKARMKELAEKVANLQQELVREKTLRERSEKEVELLCLEKEELYEELDETRYQLHMSHQDLRFDEEDELRFDEEEELEYEISITEAEAGPERRPRRNSSWQFPISGDQPSSDGSSESPMNCRAFSASKEYYSFSDVRLSNRLKEQSGGMKAVTGSWVNLNVRHYELDDYDSELEVEQEKTPLSFLETLRKLRLRTNSLYEEAVSEGKDLHLLKDRVSRGYSPPKKNMPKRRRHTVWTF